MVVSPLTNVHPLPPTLLKISLAPAQDDSCQSFPSDIISSSLEDTSQYFIPHLKSSTVNAFFFSMLGQ